MKSRKYPRAGQNSMYLGPPNTMGRNKNAIMGFIKDRPQKRINGWDNKLLLRVGEVLLKMVTQGMPIYAMSVFMLTDELHNEKEKKKMNKFWWTSNSRGGKRIWWMRWERLSVH